VISAYVDFDIKYARDLRTDVFLRALEVFRAKYQVAPDAVLRFGYRGSDEKTVECCERNLGQFFVGPYWTSYALEVAKAVMDVVVRGVPLDAAGVRLVIWTEERPTA
jgi:hypothetical protein